MNKKHQRLLLEGAVLLFLTTATGLAFAFRQIVDPRIISGTVIIPPQFENPSNYTLRFFLLRRHGRVIGEESQHRATLEQDGTFQIGMASGRDRPVTPGSYYRFAWLRDPPTFEPATTSFGLVVDAVRLSDPRFAYSGSVAMEVYPVNVENVTITLEPTAGIEGSLVVEQNETTTKLESIRLFLEPLYSEPGTVLPPSILSSSRLAPVQPNSAGAFTFPKLPTGRYGIRIEGLPDDAYIADIRQGEGSVYERGIEIFRGTALPVQVLIRAKGATITGAVQDDEGLPVPYTTVVLIPMNSRRGNAMFYKVGETDAGGVFGLRGVPPGEYKLFAWKEDRKGAYQDPDFLSDYEDRGTVVKAMDTETTEPFLLHLISNTGRLN